MCDLRLKFGGMKFVIALRGKNSLSHPCAPLHAHTRSYFFVRQLLLVMLFKRKNYSFFFVILKISYSEILDQESKTRVSKSILGALAEK